MKKNNWMKIIILAIGILMVIIIVSKFYQKSEKPKTNTYNDSLSGVSFNYPVGWQLESKPSVELSRKEALESGKAKLTFVPNTSDNQGKIGVMIIPTNQELDAVAKQNSLYREKERKNFRGVKWSLGEISKTKENAKSTCLGFGITPNASNEFKEFKNNLITITCEKANLEIKKLRDFTRGIVINDN